MVGTGVVAWRSAGVVAAAGRGTIAAVAAAADGPYAGGSREVGHSGGRRDMERHKDEGGRVKGPVGTRNDGKALVACVPVGGASQASWAAPAGAECRWRQSLATDQRQRARQPRRV